MPGSHSGNRRGAEAAGIPAEPPAGSLTPPRGPVMLAEGVLDLDRGDALGRPAAGVSGQPKGERPRKTPL